MTELTVIFACLVLNALFACFEMAFVTVGKPQLSQLAKAGNRAATHLLRLRQNPERTLSVIQVGITLVGIISAAAGGAGAEEAFAPWFEKTYGITENTAEAISIVIVVVPLTLLNVVFGELIPKAIALRSPVQVATFGVRAVAVVDKLFSPIVWILEKVTKAFLKLLPKNRASANVDQVASVDIDHLSRQTQQYVLNLVSIEQRRVQDVMVPWSRVDVLNSGSTRDEVAAVAVRSGHTRLPVLQDGKVVGLLHTKEFITMLANGFDDWPSIVRPVIQVSPHATALRALREMQIKKSHMALVIKDEEPVGIVTFEDVMEEIVGEFFDEDDDGTVRKLLISRSQRRLRT